MVQLMVQIKGS